MDSKKLDLRWFLHLDQAFLVSTTVSKTAVFESEKEMFFEYNKSLKTSHFLDTC